MKIKAILNHHSRNARNTLGDVLRAELGENLTGIFETRYRGHATELARSAADEGVEAVAVIGGDGTVNEATNGLVGSNVALGIIPTGTANDLALHYHLPARPDEACRNFLRPRIECIDLIEVNGWHYVTGGGVGLPCDVARIANNLKGRHGLRAVISRLLGSNVYLLSLLLALREKSDESNPVTVCYDGTVLRGDFLWLMAENQPVIGKRFIMSPQAENADGLLDICLVDNHKSNLEILSISRRVTKGAHVGLQSVTIAQSRELSMTFDRPVPFFGDGESIEPCREFRLKVIPRALRLITGRLPEGGFGRESSPHLCSRIAKRTLQ